MENDAGRKALPRAQAADAMPEVDAIDAACADNRTCMSGENHGFPLTQRDDLGARLHARALFRHDEFAAHEIAAGLGQEDRRL